MKIRLGSNAYGKNAVNLSKIIRREGYHDLKQISVNVQLEGDFETAHTLGDNTNILPTDTQKNTVYVLAKDHFNSSIEDFGLYLAHYFLANNDQVSKSSIEITEHSWVRMSFDGTTHPHAFIGGHSEKHFTMIEQTANGSTVSSGIKDLLILKTTDSGFEHFIRDAYTTLKGTDDRIMATQCKAQWRYVSPEIDFQAAYEGIRTTLLKTFAHHKSLSVQHTLYAMGEQVLKEHEVVKEISLVMPNKHHILFNLEQFGVENRNEIFIATDEPYGYITGTVVRE
ncbi:MAG: urate oxidase [Flavisolibacter sp.]|nr:urate oxidase [Flavisolibacter sp.]